MNKGNKIGARILKRIILFAVVMFLLSVVVFWMARLAPGDPLQSFYGDSLEMMTSEEIAAARTRLGLDQGIAVQYVKWLTNAVHGEFGLSLKYRQPVMNVIKPLIGNTLVLGGVAYVVIFTLAILIAIFCTLHEDQWIDRLICKIGTVAFYVPAFWLGGGTDTDLQRKSGMGFRAVALMMSEWQTALAIVSDIWYFRLWL